MNPAATLHILVKANTAQAQAALAKTHAQLRTTDTTMAKTTKSSGKLGGAFKSLAGGAGLLAGAGGLVALGAVARKAFDEFEEAQKATRQTEAVLKSTGNTAKVTAKEIEALAQKISLKSGIDDEAIQSGENLLLTFTKIRNETGKGNDIFSRSTQVIVDMSVAMDQSLKSSAIQVGKALQDPTKGMTALRRVGVSFTADQEKMVEGWVKHGQQLRAQKFILRELTTEFGGSAAAQATSSMKLRVAWDNLLEQFGRTFGPALQRGMAALARFINQMQNGKGAGGEFARTMKSLKPVFDVLVFLVKKWYEGLFALIGVWIKVGRVAVNTSKDIWQWVRKAVNNVADFASGVKGGLVNAWRFAARIFGNVMAAILRGFGKLFDVASKLPVIGGKFKELGNDARRAADKVDRLGERVRDLPSKKTVRVMVRLAMSDLRAGKVKPLVDINDPNAFGGPLTEGIEDRVRGWVERNRDRFAPLLGQPGGGRLPGGLAAIRRISLAMGLSGGLGPGQGFRPGDDGWHGSGRALDNSGTAANMMRFAKYMFSRFGSRLLELIYTPMGVGIKNGRPVNIRSYYGADVAADHYDHVHVAMAKGGRTNKKVRALVGEEGPEIVDLPVGAFVHTAKRSKQMMRQRLAFFRDGGRVDARDGIGKEERPGFVRQVWGKAKALTGSTAPMPRMIFGGRGAGDFHYGWYDPYGHRVALTDALLGALEDPGHRDHQYAKKTVLHEFAHAMQTAGVHMGPKWAREGGADLWSVWASNSIFQGGLGPYGLAAYGYPGFANRVWKNKPARWWKRGQFARGGLRAAASRNLPRKMGAGSVGRFQSTSYGPPWGGIQGTGVTATGINLRQGQHRHIIAVDPDVLKLGRKYWAWPNPFGYRGPFLAGDTGGALQGNRVDFYDWRGRQKQLGWGRRAVSIYSSNPWSKAGGKRPTAGKKTPRIPGATFKPKGGGPAKDRLLNANLPADTALGGFIEGYQSKFGAQNALAALNNVEGNAATFADDIAALTMQRGVWQSLLNSAIAGRAGPDTITTLATNLKSADDSIKQLTEVTDDLAEQQKAATEAHTQAVKDMTNQMKRNEQLVKAQGPALLAALTQIVNGGIGGNAGLGRQFPSSVGLGGLSRT